MSVELTFHGACGTVTGSCFELRTSRTAVLVDCGMFQGTKTIKELNYGKFPFVPRSIAAAVVTHAHIDHCGLVPKLIAAGFSGRVHATAATADLMTYVLPDSGYIQEIEVERLNRRNRQRGKAAVEPIYTRELAERALQRVTPAPYDTWIGIAPGIKVRFWDAGHILGSASIEVEVTGEDQAPDPMRIVFSGDIGTGDKAFQSAPLGPRGADFVITESTYGAITRKARSVASRRQILLKELKAALKAGGIILIPAFAVERTQELLVDLDALFDSKQVPTLPVFVDSPLAQRATEVFDKHLTGKIDGDGTHPFRRANVRYVETPEESKRLNRLRGGAIIMAGSGMCDAGRIRHHLKAHLGRSDTTVMLVGYQAPGTLGSLLLDGKRMIRIHGEDTAVEARIRFMDEYSGHADQNGLVAWVKDRQPIAHQTFLVHGEDGARSGMAAALVQAGFRKRDIRQPVHGETVRLSKQSGAKTARVRSVVDVAACCQSDWHNEYAATVLSLKKELEALPDDASRARVLRGMRSKLRTGKTRKGARRRR